MLARQIGIDLTDAHWKVDPLPARATTPDTGRDRDDCAASQTVGGIPVKEQFALFPKKPAKKMAYIAGLPKPHGCV